MNKAAPLPRRQAQLLCYLSRYLTLQGRPPELWRMDETLGYPGTLGRASHTGRVLGALRARRLVAWRGGDLRTLRLTTAGLMALAGEQT